VHIFKVTFICSVLTLAAILAYGFLFGLQSRPVGSVQPDTWLVLLYFPVIALIGGAVAAIPVVVWRSRLSVSERFTLGGGIGFGMLAGTITGTFLFIWQILFAAIVNVLLERPGLFVIPSSRPHEALDPDLIIIDLVVTLLLTSLYSFAEWVAATIGGALAGGIATALYAAFRDRLPG
jgi:hypothetical protein